MTAIYDTAPVTALLPANSIDKLYAAQKTKQLEDGTTCLVYRGWVTKVFLISNIDITEQYRNIQYESPATWEAFLRRIQKVILYTGINEYTEYETQEYLRTAWTRQPIAGDWEPPPPLPTEPPPECEQQKL